MRKTHGLLNGRKVEVVPANCYKPKPKFADEFLCKPWHHIAVINWTVGIVYVWDTREIVDTVSLSLADKQMLVHALDNGEDLVIPEDRRDLLETMQELQDSIHLEDWQISAQ